MACAASFRSLPSIALMNCPSNCTSLASNALLVSLPIIHLPSSHRLASAQLHLPFRTSRFMKASAFHSSVEFLGRELQNTFNSPLLHESVQLLCAMIPAGLAALGCKGLRIGMGKEISVAVFRCSIQLFLLAFVLQFVVDGERLLVSVLAVTGMVLVAGHIAGERAKELPNSCLIATFSLALGTLGTLLLMIVLKVCPLKAHYIIPTAGYLIGDSMGTVGATLNVLSHSIRDNAGQIEAALSLGASPQQAVKNYIQHSVLQGAGPFIGSIKTTGLVTIPGALTGLIMGGLRPLEAVQLQAQLLYMLLGAAALSSAISSYLGWRVYFSKFCQLVVKDLATS